jgi:UDP-N-acetyl-D-glucosamine dehydrogenase
MDAVIIITDHSDYNFAEIVKHSNLVVDTRNATKEIKEHREKIVMA